jgi:hypothetical protein
MRSLDVVALSTPRLSPQRRLMSEIRVLARSPRKRALRWRRSERATVRAARLRAGPVKFDSALSQERLFQRDRTIFRVACRPAMAEALPLHEGAS